jgi:hypothetical protein
MQSDEYASNRGELNKSDDRHAITDGAAHCGTHRHQEDKTMTKASEVIGVWRLRSYYLEVQQTGERIEPYGTHPKGVFMIHPDGRVAKTRN